ncbi:MAG: threonine/serine dehydratase [Bacteroidia bacterium]
MPQDLTHAIEIARERIRPYIIETPVEASPALGAELQAEVWLKMEHLQITGSFKLRGATNKVLSVGGDRVVTASTGNHGAAVAHICRQTGRQALVFLPETASTAKVRYLHLLGADLRYHGQDSVETEYEARRYADAAGLPYISPYNDPEVVAGQGTLAAELMHQLPYLDAVLVPVGGGGLIGGMAAYIKQLFPHVQVIGCQPTQSAVMYASIRAGRVLDLPSYPTLSDGTAGGLEPDSITFGLCRDWVDDFILVSEDEIRAALRYLIETHYLLVEGAAALSLAALRQQAGRFAGKRVALILCGRKLGIDTLREVIA